MQALCSFSRASLRTYLPKANPLWWNFGPLGAPQALHQCPLRAAGIAHLRNFCKIKQSRLNVSPAMCDGVQVRTMPAGVSAPFTDRAGQCAARADRGGHQPGARQPPAAELCSAAGLQDGLRGALFSHTPCCVALSSKWAGKSLMIYRLRGQHTRGLRGDEVSTLGFPGVACSGGGRDSRC